MSPFPFNTTPLITINRVGWLGLGESRLILMDALGGFRTLRELISQELGQEAEADMAQRAGYASAERLVAAALGSGDLSRDEAGFHKALELITSAGYGHFRATEIRFHDRWARVAVDGSMEGWMFRESGGRLSAGCDFTRGLLAGLMHFLSLPAYVAPDESESDDAAAVDLDLEAFPDQSIEPAEPLDVSCIELGCTATGEEICQFVLGPSNLLLADGLTPANSAQSSVRETLLRLNRQLEQILDTSRKDPLTRLYNRSHFDQSLRQRIGYAKRRSDVVSLAIIDVDSFKSINDSQGHSVGDRVLRQVARALENQAREDDIVARLGGDEFVWLMPATHGDTALLVAQRLRKTIGELAPTIGFGVNISVGVASYPQDALSPTDLYERADMALFAAKRGGRDQAVRYNATASAGQGSPGNALSENLNGSSTTNGRSGSRQSERTVIRNGDNMYTFGNPQAQLPSIRLSTDLEAISSAPAQSRVTRHGSDSEATGTLGGRNSNSMLLEAIIAPVRSSRADSTLIAEAASVFPPSRRFGKKKRY